MTRKWLQTLRLWGVQWAPRGRWMTSLLVSFNNYMVHMLFSFPRAHYKEDSCVDLLWGRAGGRSVGRLVGMGNLIISKVLLKSLYKPLFPQFSWAPAHEASRWLICWLTLRDKAPIWPITNDTMEALPCRMHACLPLKFPLRCIFSRGSGVRGPMGFWRDC